MVRRVVRKKRFRFDDSRNMTRKDEEHFSWMVSNGFFYDLTEGWYEVTQKGKDASELGFFEV